LVVGRCTLQYKHAYHYNKYNKYTLPNPFNFHCITIILFKCKNMFILFAPETETFDFFCVHPHR
jgi:hypothetical protein